MMQLRFFACLVLCFSLLSAGAFAQTTSASIPKFSPTSAWLVGPTGLAQTRGLQDIKLPCVLANQYDNGFVVRFSGGGQRILVMAIDFRQNAFQQGRKYKTTISIDQTYNQQAEATAFTESILIFNLRDMNGFYPALQNGGFMDLKIANNALRFYLYNIKEGMDRLEGCYGGGNLTPMIQQAGNTAEQNLLMAEEKALVGPTERSMTFEGPVGVMPESQDMTQDMTREPVQQARLSPMFENKLDNQSLENRWTAAQGDTVKNVLLRWSDQAGYDLVWDAQNDGGRLSQDINLSGSYEEAVSMLLGQYGSSQGLSGQFQDGTQQTVAEQTVNANMGVSSPASTSLMPLVTRPKQTASAMPKSPGSAHTHGNMAHGNMTRQARWTAQPGDNLKTVLNAWAYKENATLIWQARHNSYEIRQPVAVNGSFDDAVAQILDQFGNDSQRPFGRLNIDPETGTKILYIEHSDISS